MIGQIAEFDTIFYDEEAKNLDDYLYGISKERLILFGIFCASISNHESKYNDFYHAVDLFFRKENEAIYRNVISRFEQYRDKEKREGRTGQIQVFNPASSLYLVEYVIKCEDWENKVSEKDAELLMLKAYLLINQTTRKLDKVASTSTEHLDDAIKLDALVFSQSFAYSDLLNINKKEMFAGQIIRAIKLFKFLETHDTNTADLLNVFCETYKVSSWQEYLRYLMPIVLAAFKSDGNKHSTIKITKNEFYQKSVEFLKLFSIATDDYLSQNNFTQLRNLVLWQRSEDEFVLIFPPFVIEKMFYSLYFQLNEINKSLELFGNFRAFYTEYFSERVALYDVLDNIFSHKYVKITGSQFKEDGLEAEPDYYARKKNNIYLFESKDNLINASIKDSADFNLYEKELYKRFVKHGEKAGAVMQLLNGIKNILNQDFRLDSSYDINKITIYPILVVHHHMFNTSGFNRVLNFWFEEELTKLGADGYDISRVQNLTVINIDTLITCQDLFKRGLLSLACLIEGYIKNSKSKANAKYSIEELKRIRFRQMEPFTNFVHSRTIVKKFLKVSAVSRPYYKQIFDN